MSDGMADGTDGIADEMTGAMIQDIEALRAEGQVGSSLQATLSLKVGSADRALLSSLGDDLKFVFITSAISLEEGKDIAATVSASTATKCERCWHYRDDVGHDTAHPTLCGRCTSNLYGDGEKREFA